MITILNSIDVAKKELAPQWCELSDLFFYSQIGVVKNRIEWRRRKI